MTEDTKFEPYMSQTSISSIMSDLNRDNDEGGINLDIEYQRDIVWDNDKQSFFINSLLKGISPNPIIFNLNEEEGIKDCIDGKQRLTSIKRFIENEFTVDYNQSLYYNNANKPSLDRIIRNKFNNFKIFTIEYKNLNYKDQLEIFGRIQHGAPLQHGETLLTHINDPNQSNLYSETCFKLSSKLDNRVFNTSQLKRRKHYKFILEVSFLLNNGINNLCPRKLDNFLREKSANPPYFQQMLTQTEELLNNCFQDDFLRSERLNSQINKNIWLMCIFTYFKHPYINRGDMVNCITFNNQQFKQFGNKCDKETMTKIYDYLKTSTLK